MIPYELNEDQKMFQETIKRMVKEKLAPGAQDVDKSSEFPWDLYELFREYGLPGMNIPEEYEGIGADRLTCALVLEEMGRTCNTSALILGASFLANLVLIMAGNEEQKKRFLPKIAAGESICAISLIEPELPYNIEHITTTFSSEGDECILNGKTPVISNADVADLIILLAKDNTVEGSEGVDIFILEKESSEYVCEKKGELLGEGSRQACEVIFKGCKVSGANRFAPEEGAYKRIIKILAENNFITAARALGIAQGAIDHAFEYTQTREQFGKPIIKFQGIQFMIAEMAVKVEAARQLLYKACTEMENGGKNAIKLGGTVKSYASNIAMEVAVSAVQLFGGYGVTTEYPVQRYYRNAKLTSLVEGKQDIHKKTIAGEVINPS